MVTKRRKLERGAKNAADDTAKQDASNFGSLGQLFVCEAFPNFHFQIQMNNRLDLDLQNGHSKVSGAQIINQIIIISRTFLTCFVGNREVQTRQNGRRAGVDTSSAHVWHYHTRHSHIPRPTGVQHLHHELAFRSRGPSPVSSSFMTRGPFPHGGYPPLSGLFELFL